MALPLAGRARRRMLLVDDSAAVRSFIKVHLVRHAFEFVEADDGDRALYFARLVSIDLVIADVNMPVLDGISFVRRLRTSDDIALRRLPVLLLTGDKTSGVRDAALSAGANAFLCKPVDHDALIEAVDDLLQTSGLRLAK